MAARLAEYSASGIYFTDEDGNTKEDTITIDEVRSSSRDLRGELFMAWYYLRAIVGEHEAMLNKRWSKKTLTQRKEILLRICPNMPPMHRPDFALLRSIDLGSKSKLDKNQAMRFPHISLDDLSQPKPLLLMLDSRSRNSPSAFSFTDQKSLGVGVKSKMIIPHYIRGYTMYLAGEHTVDTYGRLVSWEEDRMAIMKYYQGLAPDPGMGLLVLSNQSWILTFLLRCSLAILHDIPVMEKAGALIENLIPLSITPPLLRRDDRLCPKFPVIDSESLAARTWEAPYRKPDAFDFRRLKSIVDAKHNELRDQLHLLHEDPYFFAEQVKEQCWLTKEALRQRRYDARFSSLSEDSRIEVTCQILEHMHRQAFTWGLVSGLLNELIDSYTKHEDQIHLGQSLPEPFIKVFSRLEHVIESIVQGCLQCLPGCLAAIPTFRQQIGFDLLAKTVNIQKNSSKPLTSYSLHSSIGMDVVVAQHHRGSPHVS